MSILTITQVITWICIFLCMLLFKQLFFESDGSFYLSKFFLRFLSPEPYCMYNCHRELGSYFYDYSD